MRALAGMLLLVAAVPLRGQDPTGQESVRADLARLKNELLHSQDEVDRLMHLRLRHDLGLPVEDAIVPPADRPATSSAIEEARLELQREERVTADLARRYERLEEQARRMLARAERVEPESVPDWVAVPQPYMLPPADSQPAAPAGETPPATDVAPGPEQQPFPGDANPAGLLELDPVRGQIQGSRSPGVVARSLYRAAMELVATGSRLRSMGRIAAATEYDALAAERLHRALDVLAPAVEGEAPAFSDLFYQGKCREALFRLDERNAGLNLRDKPVEYQRREQDVRDPFLAITVRDVEVKGGAENLGRWGKAAQAALDHFRWMNVHGNFVPSLDPASISWGGR